MFPLLVVVAAAASPPVTVVCTPAKPTVVRADPKLDATSLGVLAASTCGVVARSSASGGTGIASDTWLYVEQPGGLAGWAFVSGADAKAWKLDTNVPAMRDLQAQKTLDAVASGARGNMLGILTANLAYDAAFDGFVSAPTCPVAKVGTTPMPWTGECTAAGWRDLGWRPDGPVSCAYSTLAVGGAARVLVYAVCDADGDGAQAVYVLDYVAGKSVPAGKDIVALSAAGVR